MLVDAYAHPVKILHLLPVCHHDYFHDTPACPPVIIPRSREIDPTFNGKFLHLPLQHSLKNRDDAIPVIRVNMCHKLVQSIQVFLHELVFGKALTDIQYIILDIVIPRERL